MTDTGRLARLDFHLILRNTLLVSLMLAYVFCVFVLVVSLGILPFGDPDTLMVAPDWLTPAFGYMPLLDAVLFIVFGPSAGISLLGGLVVAITAPTVHRWLRSGVDELLDGAGDEPQERALSVMAQLTPHLDAMTAPYPAILPTIVATIAQSLKLPYVAIETPTALTATPATAPPTAPLPTETSPEGGLIVFGVCPPDTELTRLPLHYRDTQIGELHVATRHGASLSAANLAVLHMLARQVGIALYAAQLTDELQRARIRLVTAQEEERRRIRRDLHDGLGPMLASFAMQLETAREKLPDDAAESADRLAHLAEQMQTIIGDIRRLVYALRPPDLDEFGLLSALREYLRRMQTGVVVFDLMAPPTLPPLPAAVEVAVYRIVQEATSNALRHAQPGIVRVTLVVEAQASHTSTETSTHNLLHVEIEDNGRGLPTQPTNGIGMHSMRERAEELGGTWRIEPVDGGGTRVVAQFAFMVDANSDHASDTSDASETET